MVTLKDDVVLVYIHYRYKIYRDDIDQMHRTLTYAYLSLPENGHIISNPVPKHPKTGIINEMW